MRKVTAMGQKIGEKIREARKAAGMNQGQLAERLGMPQSQVSDWERGEVMPSVPSLVKLAPALKIDVSLLIDCLIG